MSKSNNPESPRKGILWLYGLPGIPLAMLVGPVYAFLPNYLTETVGLSAIGVGLALSITRLWDVISDPLGGVVSDQTKSRAFWMIAGMPLSMLGVFFLFVEAQLLSITGLALASIALYTGWTLTKLNHDAWGAELSPDYDDRTRYASAREGAGLLGFLVVVVLLGSADSQGPAVLARAFKGLGIFLLIALPAAFFFSIWRLPAGERVKTKAKLGDFKALWQDVSLRKLASAFLLNGIAAALPATLFLDYVQYKLGRPELAGPLLIVYFLCGVVAIPGWLALSRKLDKAKAWSASMAWATSFFIIVPFLNAGDEIYFAIICVLTGVSLGADLALPAAIQADLVDARRAQTGRQQTGLLFALLGMLTKLAYAVGVLAYPALALAGFRSSEGNETTPEGLMALGILYGAVPCAAKLGAIWIMRDFPMTRDALAAVQQKI
ncbi:MAG: MFS transporter [Pseudomonadota bacterium]